MRRVQLLLSLITMAVALTGCEVAERFVALRSKIISSSPSSFTLEIVNPPSSTSALSALDTDLKIEVYDETGSLVAEPVVIKAEIVDDPTGLAELLGDLEVTTVGGIADFSALALDLPGTGYTVRFYIDDGPEVQTDPFDVVTLAVTVDPLFPINGANFMDYVPRVTTKKIHEQEDRTDLISTLNFHGGEIRKVRLPDIATCDGLTAEETLDAFLWECSDEGSQTFFYSKRFKDGKGLRDLLNSNSFKTNNVEIKKSGLTVAESTLATWWTNTVTPLTLNSGVADAVLSLNSSGTIYTVSASGATRGIQMDATKVALVTLGSNTVISNTAASAAIDCQSLFGGAQSICMIAGSGHSGWIEAKINYTLAVRAIYVGTGSTFTTATNNFRIHNSEITTTHASSIGVHVQAGYFNMTDTYVKTSGTVGVRHQNGYYSNFDNVHVSGGSVAGIMSETGSWYAFFNRLTVENSGGHGLDTTGYYKTVLNSKIFNNAGSGIRLGTSQDSTVQNSIISGNGNVGIQIGASADSNFISGNFVGNNAEVGIEFQNVSGVGYPSFFENNAVSNNGTGLYFADSEDWTLSNSIIRGNFDAIVIADGSTDLVWSNKLMLDGNDNGCFFSVAGANPGLANAACDNQGASTATRITATDTSTYWVGAVADPANTHATGISLFSALTDWRQFSTRFRLWANEPAAAGADRGRCAGLATCNILDFSLTGSAAEARFVNGTPSAGATCPSSVNGSQAFQINVSYALRNAMEIPGDFIGNENGLCESGESCLFKPHIGAYQGDESQSLQSCEFVAGTNLTNIKMYFYP